MRELSVVGIVEDFEDGRIHMKSYQYGHLGNDKSKTTKLSKKIQEAHVYHTQKGSDKKNVIFM